MTPLVPLLLAALCLSGAARTAVAAIPQMHAQMVPAVPTAPSTQRTRPAPVKVAAAPAAEAPPTWAELSAGQKQALGPLARTWPTLTEAHKRKWIALSQNFAAMPPAEKVRVHSRMAEWAALTPNQRTQARLNFGEAKELSAEDKKARWEAYQALPPEEKRKLAAGAKAAKPPPPPTAAAVRPVPQQKLATVPKPKRTEAASPRIAGAPNELDHNTLLPHPGAAPAQP